jgi:IS66 Orf2 like protein
MTLLPRGLKVHLALGYTDMRKGIDVLAMLVQAVLRQDPFSGVHLVRSRRRQLRQTCGSALIRPSVAPPRVPAHRSDRWYSRWPNSPSLPPRP